MYAGQLQSGSDGELHELDSGTRINPEGGMWLYETCCHLKPKQTVEIGLAYGFSTIYLLAAIYKNGSGFHIAIDPFEDRDWHGIGLCQSEKLAMKHAFHFINEKSVPALADLARNNQRFELILIDGNHRFDDVLVDFTLSTEVCSSGGYIVLDDTWMASIQRAVSFIRKNRADFSEIVTSVPNMAVFKRIGDDLREWNHYVDF
jgi:predicted O-methyltransferase YrrM